MDLAQDFENIELQMLINNKQDGFNYKQRRIEDWRVNYQLYRDRVQVNRLTQRQSVNLPIMKTMLRTLMKDIDDMPIVVFENLDNDKEAEVFQNEYWKETLNTNTAEIQDIVDKKQDFFYGRTFDSWQIVDGKIVFDIEDPEDILVPRYINPYNLDSGRFLIHQHIFVPLSKLKEEEDYDQKEVQKLTDFFQSKLGLVKAKDNENSLQLKNQKLGEMGVADIDDPILGETYVELTLHFVFRPKDEKWKDMKTKESGTTDTEQIFVYVEAEERTILMKKPQEKIIGLTSDHYWQTHYRYNSWGDDIDNQDFWTDGIADIARVPNIVANSWFSQEVENRTLRNYNMQYYDSSLKAEGFNPSTFNPVPWGWYPVPGKPNESIQRIDVPALTDSYQDMDYVVQMVEKATGATPGQQGVNPPSGTPLGTTQIVEGEAKSRTKGISKFYTKCWEQRAEKFLKLIEAGSDKLDAVKIYKKGKNTDTIFSREIAPKDWMTKSGYKVRVWSKDEKNSRDTESIQKLQALKMAMPDNPKVSEIYNRKLAEYSDLTPDEIVDIMDYEKKKVQGMALPGLPGQSVNPMNPGIPVQQPIMPQMAQPIQR